MKGLSFQVKRQVEQPDRGIPIPKQIQMMPIRLFNVQY
jgi:hypothetical protein